ncbi:hypothetical protein SVAN01_02041 [Stagonosporopsis vannaccii]|nr:hypothetical protein SVAN01_02041 [Stagonosporopsis vannaccii]
MRLVAQCLPLLLWSWAGSARAADCSGDFAINGPDDITTLNQCITFNGNVSLAGKGVQDITLNGLKQVTGIISIADTDALLSVSSTTLESFWTLKLNNLPKLTTLNLPALTNFSKLDFSGLNSLQDCEIATGALQQDVSEISIFGTALKKMDWLKWPVTTALTIAANMNLTDFTIPYDRISAGSSYQFSINRDLSNLDFSQLKGIYGSLAVNGNNDKSLNFDNLENIDGYVRLSGPFSNITMPQLTSINGALRADSTIDILAFCNWLSVQDRLFGHYDCTANNTDPLASSTTTTSPTNTSVAVPTLPAESNGNGSSLSTGAIVGIAVAMVVLISVVLTTTALLFFRRRRNKKVAHQTHQAAAPCEAKKTHSTSTLGEELDASNIRYELGQEREAHELQGPGLATELEGQTLQELDCEKPYFRDHKPAPDSPVGRFELP